MFTALKSHFSIMYSANYSTSGIITHRPQGMGAEEFVNYGEDRKWWDKVMARIDRSNSWIKIFTYRDMLIVVRLTDDKKFQMQIEMIAKNQTVKTKNEIHHLTFMLFEDWIHNGVLDQELLRQIGVLANINSL